MLLPRPRPALAPALRAVYMQKAQDLMEGSLQKCRLYSKIDRWEAQIAEAIADDQAAGIYPAIGGQHPNFAESVG